MKQDKRIIYVLGINSFKFEDLQLNIQKLFLETKFIAAPEKYLDNIKKWHQNKKEKKIFFASKSDSNLIDWLIAREKNVILITRGDPLWFGIGRILIENFSKEELYFYPASSCVQIAFSKLKKTWQDTTFISIHGRDHTKLIKALKSQNSNLSVITDQKSKSVELVRKNLIELNLQNFYEFWLCEDLGFEKEKITKIDIEKRLPSQISDLNIIVLLKRESLPEKKYLPLFGLNDDNFKTFDDRPNLMTKREVRIQILADLELPEEGVLWDVGAGCGSIGLEAIRLRPKLKLFSIDKRFGTKKLIESNSKRLDVKPQNIYEKDINIIINKGITNYLEIPNRIIIGGCDNQTKISIIKYVSKLKIKYLIIVIPIITLENLKEIKLILENNKFITSFTLIQISKSLSIAEGSRLEPSNPVFILKGRRNL